MEFVVGGGGGRGGGAFFDVSPLICTLSGESYSFSLIIMLYYFILGLGGGGGVAVFVVFPSCILLGLLVPVVLVGAVDHYEPRCRHCHEVVNKPIKIKRRTKSSQ